MKGVEIIANYSLKFTYDNIMSSDFGLILCSFENENQSNIISSSIELTTYKSPLSNRWFKYGYQYTDPIQFSITVGKYNDYKFKKLTKQEVGQINRWLMRTDGYHWFQFYDKKFGDIFFNCTAIKSEEVLISSETYGIKYTFITDSPFAYSEIKEVYFVATENLKSFTIYDYSDDIGHLYPHTTIKLLEAGNLTLHNSIEDRTITINNCSKGEIITMDGVYKNIHSSNTLHKLYDDFNWKYFRIANSFNNRENVITTSLKCEITMNWREIRKVGV
ncbi:hypothetical protein KQI61_07915 [Anaerocolumna aminovalerica]|uniref:phage tail domain-containing protein n=1 Tax=Anaerocolumna aminovalerica TaxID=1527 RepID=UPI001C0EAFDD|nr:phage tail domain-containing protein [Anaerocolumna aminovalerica]MBU5332122.1 hypothetical protein [Anaerocolumna aminovalerica]